MCYEKTIFDILFFIPSGYNFPHSGYNFSLSSLVSSVPNEFIVMIKALLSASNAKISHITSCVSPPMFLQKLYGASDNYMCQTKVVFACGLKVIKGV